MHEEVLSDSQRKLLSLLQIFNKNFGLIGGTAIALRLGHRRSVDFDLATLKVIRHQLLRDQIKKYFEIQDILVDTANEQTFIVNGVKLTFMKFPFPISFTENFQDIIRTPNLTTLAAMKAYSLGRRAKWKDYVDLYFVFQKTPFSEVVARAEALFKSEFNSRLFREQLAYFDDIDYSEEVDYLLGFETPNEIIKKSLAEVSLDKPK